MAYRCVVVGTDGSATASTAVDHAASLAASSDARLVIVTAFERHDEAQDAVPADIRWILTDASEADHIARTGRERAKEIGVADVVVQAVGGQPAEQLIEAAETFGADVIVVGSVGLAGAAGIVLGSVASTVAHHAPCDVLVVQTDS